MRIRRLLAGVSLCALVFTLRSGLGAAPTEELRPGVWAGAQVSRLPLPGSGYQVYLVGEMHGLEETGTILRQYLEQLARSGLRDVAIEKPSVYERDAQAYVAGTSDNLPGELCLRTDVLDVLRSFNRGRPADQRIRIHLVDIDTPGTAIRQHLSMIRDRLAATAAVRIPEVTALKAQGLETVKQLRSLRANPELLSELRTIEHSIGALRQGFELQPRQVQFKGSPYLEDREEAIARNIGDVVREHGSVLALYGSDHVSRALKKDGGPNRDADFAPMALRLARAGVSVFSVITFPLSGSWRSRNGRENEMLWTAADGHLASGETLDHLLTAAHNPPLLYVDPKRERITLPSQDITALAVDAFILIPKATPMADRCGIH